MRSLKDTPPEEMEQPTVATMATLATVATVATTATLRGRSQCLLIFIDFH